MKVSKQFFIETLANAVFYKFYNNKKHGARNENEAKAYSQYISANSILLMKLLIVVLLLGRV